MIKLKRLIGYVRSILRTPFWIPELKVMTHYTRVHDDCLGDMEQVMEVIFDEQGDVHIRTRGNNGGYLRFRTSGGGGGSLLVRNALMVLAYAISLDNNENPQNYE